MCIVATQITKPKAVLRVVDADELLKLVTIIQTCFYSSGDAIRATSSGLAVCRYYVAPQAPILPVRLSPVPCMRFERLFLGSPSLLSLRLGGSYPHSFRDVFHRGGPVRQQSGDAYNESGAMPKERVP